MDQIFGSNLTQFFTLDIAVRPVFFIYVLILEKKRKYYLQYFSIICREGYIIILITQELRF